MEQTRLASCNPRTLGVETGGSEVQGHPCLPGELGYMKPCLKKKKWKVDILWLRKYLEKKQKSMYLYLLLLERLDVSISSILFPRGYLVRISAVSENLHFTNP